MPGGGVGFFWGKSQGGEGFSGGGRARGAGRVSAPNWGIFFFWGGGNLNIFFSGAETSTK